MTTPSERETWHWHDAPTGLLALCGCDDGFHSPLKWGATVLALSESARGFIIRSFATAFTPHPTGDAPGREKEGK